jgi:hypothetical protein
MPLCCSKLLLQPAGICVVLGPKKSSTIPANTPPGFEPRLPICQHLLFLSNEELLGQTLTFCRLFVPAIKPIWDINDGVCDDVRVDVYG